MDRIRCCDAACATPVCGNISESCIAPCSSAKQNRRAVALCGGGEWKATSMAYQSVNPSNGELLRTFDEHTDQQMEEMLVTAEQTFREVWSRKPIHARAQVVGKAASLMLEQKEKFARLATIEMGKRIAESRGEVELSASILQYYADHAEKFLATRPLNSIAGDAYIEYSPLGVLVGVQPWNYPYYQLARFAAPHLTSGNIMLVNDQVAKLIDDPRIRGVALTGS